MSDGYFIGRGDKTSCGGEVLDGDDRVNMFGLLHAREGDRVSCGANGGIYRIAGACPSSIAMASWWRARWTVSVIAPAGRG